MQRRALLAGIGLSSIGVGAAFGSGAFTTVSANRTVDLSVQKDESARIGFSPGSGASSIIGTSTDSSSVNVITVSKSDLNDRAKTVFEDALTVTNNGGAGDPAVDIYIEDESSVPVGTESADVLDLQTATDSNSIVGSTNAVEVSTDGGSQSLDVVIDLRDSSVDGSTFDDITEITFVANSV
ncbi:hypothetical protein [Halorubrum sp. GN12_10-3_MGM]|uniref:hypothetical protein n=1 Tax=Halorubrum sp. GN12_10-3_MGM TaxID=2518113 RepID=UPI0010F53B5E|nr:hypothetical protein [Halorubrum sp. GN12_10-3_MGM]TKX62662.1 hypothetical protein EXE47_15085 [Halorubrum sp. GN12_10-3_MGM]